MMYFCQKNPISLIWDISCGAIGKHSAPILYHLSYTLSFLIGLTIRLEDSITVMAAGICTKIFFNHAVTYTINRPYVR